MTLVQRQKVSSEVYFFVFDAQLGADIVSMKLNGSGGQIADFSDVLCGFTLLDEVSDLNFAGR